MKIAFFTEGYEPFINGVVVSIKTLKEALERRGHEVVIFAPAYPRHQEREQGVVRLPSVRWSRKYYRLLSPLVWNRDVLAGQGFDLVHTHHPFTMGTLAARLARKHHLPLVHTFHTILTEYTVYVPFVGACGKRLIERIFLRHCAQADRVIAATSTVRDFLREHGVQTPISVVAAGIPSISPGPGSRERIRRLLEIPRDVPALLYAGRLAKEKHLDFLLRATAGLGATHDFRLCLVGGGAMETSLRDLAARLGIGDRVIFCGWIPPEQIADFYAAADLFVFPSPTDAMGIVLVEAMSVGLPCVAVDRYGPREVVVDGATGFLVPFEEEPFADAVRRLLDDQPLRRQMGEAARRRAREYDADLATDRLCVVYEDVLREARRARRLCTRTAPCPLAPSPQGRGQRQDVALP